MTQEEKAKRYDEALEMAKKLIENEETNVPVFYVNNIKDIFPELKESIDERIKKVIKQVLSESTTEKDECYLDNGVTQQEVFAWLEKQGEQPKKHDVCDNCDQQGCCVSPCPMKLVEKQGKEISWKPSKDEIDALYGLAYITNKMDDKKDEAITKLYQDLKREFFSGVSYENMFPSSPVDAPIKLEKQGEQKPAWSEEDERICQCLIQDQEEALDKVSNDKYGHSEIISDLEEMYRERIAFLKSLKNRVQPQTKQEWSEEDERIIKRLISLWSEVMIEPTCCRFGLHKDEVTHWLKSLKDRSTWNPSDKQMEALKEAGDEHWELDGLDSLYTLYQDLKKLKG